MEFIDIADLEIDLKFLEYERDAPLAIDQSHWKIFRSIIQMHPALGIIKNL